MAYKKCRKCGSTQIKKDDSYSPVIGAFSRVKEFKYDSYYVCMKCGYKKKLHYVTTGAKIMIVVIILALVAMFLTIFLTELSIKL